MTTTEYLIFKNLPEDAQTIFGALVLFGFLVLCIILGFNYLLNKWKKS